MTEPFRTVFAIYDGMTHLDFTGPHQVLSRLPKSETIVASRNGGSVRSEGLVFADTIRLADVHQCDLVCLPGGVNALKIAQDDAFIAEIVRLSGTARFVTSVCTGSLILGAAGLLRGRRAACHWAWRHLLTHFGAIPDDGRVVRDGRFITGGGVTAGIDFGFTVLAEIAGDEFAQAVQLGLEYAPAPPFDAGRPDLAPPAVLEHYMHFQRTLADDREADARKAALRMSAPA